MATVYLIGDSERTNSFYDAEMVTRFYGHIALNPINVPEIWEIQEAMIDASDAVLLLKGWEKSKSATMQYEYATSDKSKLLMFYAPKSEKMTKAEFNHLEEIKANG